MVIRVDLNFPASKSNINCLLGTGLVSYNSAIPNVKCISFSCPISFQLKFKNYEARHRTSASIVPQTTLQAIDLRKTTSIHLLK